MVSAHCTSNNMPLPCKVTNRHPSLPILNQSRRGPIRATARSVLYMFPQMGVSIQTCRPSEQIIDQVGQIVHGHMAVTTHIGS